MPGNQGAFACLAGAIHAHFVFFGTEGCGREDAQGEEDADHPPSEARSRGPRNVAESPKRDCNPRVATGNRPAFPSHPRDTLRNRLSRKRSPWDGGKRDVRPKWSPSETGEIDSHSDPYPGEWA